MVTVSYVRVVTSLFMVASLIVFSSQAMVNAVSCVYNGFTYDSIKLRQRCFHARTPRIVIPSGLGSPTATSCSNCGPASSWFGQHPLD